jgi:hypothetical protein
MPKNSCSFAAARKRAFERFQQSSTSCGGPQFPKAPQTTAQRNERGMDIPGGGFGQGRVPGGKGGAL